MVIVMLVASGLTGFAASAEHDHQVNPSHVFTHTPDDHRHDGWVGKLTSLLTCHSEAACSDEPAKSAEHVHVSFSLAAIASNLQWLYATPSSDAPVAPASHLHASRQFYPLLRPPRV